jgi:polyisoprenoid-binding protein YceI
MPDSMVNARYATLALALAAAFTSSGQAAAPRSNWSIDPGRTRIGFSIDAVGWPRTVGRFDKFDGKIAVDFDNPSNSRVNFHVQAGSADAGSAGFNDFVRSTALLNVDAFPSIDFTSTSVVKTSEHSVRVSGELTLLGVTHPLSVDVDVNKKSEGARTRLGFTANTKIDRLDYGMTSGYPVISRDVFLTISTEALER